VRGDERVYVHARTLPRLTCGSWTAKKGCRGSAPL
jgi:hypothetical protein